MAGEPAGPTGGETPPPEPRPRPATPAFRDVNGAGRGPPLHPAVWGLIILAAFLGAQVAAGFAVTFAWVAAGGNPQRLLQDLARSPAPGGGAVVPGLNEGWSVAFLLAAASASAAVAIPLSILAHRNRFGTTRGLWGEASGRTLRWGLVGFALILGTSAALDFGLRTVGGAGATEQFNSSLQARLTWALAKPQFLVFAIPIAGFLAPAAEEFVFRGFFFRAFNEWLGRGGARAGFWSAALASGVLWAAIHGDPVVFPVIVAFGLVLAWVYERSGSIAAPLLAHALHNTLTLVLLAFLV